MGLRRVAQGAQAPRHTGAQAHRHTFNLSLHFICFATYLGQEKVAAVVKTLGAGLLFPDCPGFFHGCGCRYFGSGAMTAAGGARAETNERKTSVCLIVFGGLSLGVLYGYCTKDVIVNDCLKKRPPRPLSWHGKTLCGDG